MKVGSRHSRADYGVRRESLIHGMRSRVSPLPLRRDLLCTEEVGLCLGSDIWEERPLEPNKLPTKPPKRRAGGRVVRVGGCAWVEGMSGWSAKGCCMCVCVFSVDETVEVGQD